jgi:hypothetical protein
MFFSLDSRLRGNDGRVGLLEKKSKISLLDPQFIPFFHTKTHNV